MNHAINIVGYGYAMSPFDLREKEYFIVRDSFVEEDIHYRIAAKELTPLIERVIKIRGLKTLTKPISYPSEHK